MYLLFNFDHLHKGNGYRSIMYGRNKDIKITLKLISGN